MCRLWAASSSGLDVDCIVHDRQVKSAAGSIVVVSSHDPASSEEACKQAGAIAYLQKPVDFEKLLKVIAEALGTPDLSP